MMLRMATIAERIKQFRGDRGLTQEAAARAADVSATTWRQWEYGRSKPSVDNLAPVACVLGVTPHDLLGWDDLAGSTDPAPVGGVANG